MTPEEEKKSQRDAYYRARESADAERELPGVQEMPELDVEAEYAKQNPPADDTAPDEAWELPAAATREPDTSGVADYPDEATRSPRPRVGKAAIGKAIASPAAPDARAQALSRMSEIAGRRYAPSAGLDDNALAKADASRRDETGRNNFTRAIQAALLRKPYEPEAVESGSAPLLARRRMEQQDFERGKSQEMSATAALGKGIVTGKAPPAITPYQQEELNLRKKQIDATSTQKARALEDRKKLMLSQYPEHASEIGALSDLGNAESLQRTLDARGTAVASQAHADEAATKSQAHADESQRRSEGFQKYMEDYRLSHRPLTAEQASQLEGINKSGKAIDTFEGGLGSVSGWGGRLAASAPAIFGALGAQGADFPALREGTAIALARGLEGGMARPGNVEIIMRMLPEASDDDAVKAQKIAHVREFVANNRDAFKTALEQGGSVPLRPSSEPAAAPRPAAPPKRPAGVPADAVFKGGKWYQRLPDGSGWDEIEVRGG